MRLTKRKMFYPKCDKQGNLTKVDCIEIKDTKLAEEKLCHLEDIEDELGIDLITLFKAFKNGIWIKYNLGSRTYDWKTGEDKETGDQIVFHKAPYKTLPENIGYFRRLFEKEYAQNYGKTWALTKEELL